MIEHFKHQIDSGWIPILEPLIESPRFVEILEVLSSSKGFEPDISKLFRAFKACPYSELKVVILGQDPYPQPGVATGLAFGNENKGDISPSLKIIMEELESIPDYNEWLFLDKLSLEHWANQGILLLNSALTVEQNKPGSHHEIWKYFIENLLRNLNQINCGIIYVLMGKVAHSFEPFINTKSNHVIKVAHPAADTYNNRRIFRGSNIFNNINSIVYNIYGQNINFI